MLCENGSIIIYYHWMKDLFACIKCSIGVIYLCVHYASKYIIHLFMKTENGLYTRMFYDENNCVITI